MSKMRDAIAEFRRSLSKINQPVEPNRSERRAHYRSHLNRPQRMQLVGFGRWRRHRYLSRGA